MLVSLSIRDIVLIEALDLDWHNGLCTLTGETGAGKSILLDALGLAVGARGDAALVRQGAAQGSVTAEFQVSPTHPAHELMQENGLPPDPSGALILRRQQMADGRSRAFCNDQAIGVGLLRQIGMALVEVHGQNESQSLTDAATQCRLLDDFAGLGQMVANVAALYAAREAASAALTAHLDADSRAREEQEFLTHAVGELDELAPQAGEETTLADERLLLMNAEKISDDLTAAADSLGGDNGVDNALNAALRRLERAAGEAGGALDNAVAAIDRALIEAAEARAAVEEAAAKIIHDPTRLQQVEDRLFALRGLARKHGCTCDELPALGETLRANLTALDDSAGAEARLRQSLTEAEAAYSAAAVQLSEARHAAAQQLDGRVNQELPPLKLDGGSFITRIETRDVMQGGASGLDRISFEATTNPGMTPGPIAKIASGGELARFMLALKVCLAAENDECTLVFDEVDAGVGGAVAEAVGMRLHALAQNGQVLVVTHSPQVAARGDYQWQVSKAIAENGVETRVVALTKDARLEEIARMLAGADITDEARAAAGRLLQAG
jgi:DNA repair protein RecN (Recombination protein N)